MCGVGYDMPAWEMRRLILLAWIWSIAPNCSSSKRERPGKRAHLGLSLATKKLSQVDWDLPTWMYYHLEWCPVDQAGEAGNGTIPSLSTFSIRAIAFASILVQA